MLNMGLTAEVICGFVKSELCDCVQLAQINIYVRLLKNVGNLYYKPARNCIAMAVIVNLLPTP